VKRLIGLRVSTLNRLVLYREKAENYWKLGCFLLGLGWWAETLVQLLQLASAYDLRKIHVTTMACVVKLSCFVHDKT
jgi:hypothetical protein